MFCNSLSHLPSWWLSGCPSSSYPKRVVAKRLVLQAKLKARKTTNSNGLTWFISKQRTFCDFYNFDETGFMMGVICAGMVVTHAERHGRGNLSSQVTGNGRHQLPVLMVKVGVSLHLWWFRALITSQTGTPRATSNTTGLSNQRVMDGPTMKQV